MCNKTCIKNTADQVMVKKCHKFVAMQQNGATLIYDLNRMNGAEESYLNKYSTAMPEELHLVL